MSKSIVKLIIFTSVIGILLLTGCQPTQNVSKAPSTIEKYIQALVDRDQNQVINLSCAEYEVQARIEYNSFEAVKSSLEGLTCKEAGTEAQKTYVTCEGVIIANYGAEDLRIEMSGRTFVTVQEAGEWRMCGYK